MLHLLCPASARGPGPSLGPGGEGTLLFAPGLVAQRPLPCWRHWGSTSPHPFWYRSAGKEGLSGQVEVASLDWVEAPVSSGGRTTMLGTEASDGACPPLTGGRYKLPM